MMNKLIKEFAQRADDYAAEYEFVNGGDEFDIFKQKFAELIVRECASICHARKLTPSTFTGDELLEHFGVK